MAYNSNKGTQHTGDVQYEGDPTDVQIDFENDFIALKTNGSQRLIVSGSAITASVDVSGSGALMVGGKLTAGNSKLTFDATTLVLTGALQQANGKVRFILPEDSDAFVIMSPDETSTQYRYDADGVDHYFNAPARFGANTGTPTHTVSVTGHVSASIGVTSSGFHTLTTVIDRTHVSSSLNISGSKFYGSGEGLTNIASTAVAPAGADTQVQYNDSGASAGSANMTFNGTTLTVAGLSNTGNTTLGDAGGDSVTINAATIDIPNVAAGTDNTVVVYDGNSLVTDEINSKVWGTDLVDKSDTPTRFEIALWSDSDSIEGKPQLTYDGNSVLAISGSISASGNISGSKFYSNGFELLAPAILSYTNPAVNRIVVGTATSTTVNAVAGLTFDGSKLVATGQVSASLGVTGSSLRTAATVIDSTHISSSLNISGSKFYGDGSTLSGLTAAAIANYNNPGTSRVITSINSNTVNAQANMTFNGSLLSVTGDASVSNDISASHGIHVTGSDPHIAIGVQRGAADNPIMLNVRPADGDGNNKILAMFQRTEASGMRTCFAVTGSGQVVVGGPHLEGVLNISGSTAETLISAKSDTANPAFTVDGVGDAVIKGYVSSSHMKMQSLHPTIQLTSSHAADVSAQIGINSAGNILLQNNTSNKHIVFKTNDAGSIKEGLRLDGAVPEVVVNQTAESLINFRVESKNNTHMLYVTGSDQVGIGVSDPAIGVTLDVSGSAMRLRNSSTPASAGTVGVQGEIRWDTNYIYICVATDTWKRVAIGTW